MPIHYLRRSTIAQQYRSELAQQLSTCIGSGNVDEAWQNVKEAMLAAFSAVCPTSPIRPQNHWISARSLSMIDARKSIPAGNACSTLSVPNCHATRRLHEGSDNDRLFKPRQEKSKGKGPSARTDDLVFLAWGLATTLANQPAPTASGISKSIFKTRRPVYFAAFTVRILKQVSQQDALALGQPGSIPALVQPSGTNETTTIRKCVHLCDEFNGRMHPVRKPVRVGSCDECRIIVFRRECLRDGSVVKALFHGSE
ncbi:hypothetical protein CLF_109409, partial [Clonorchis sinensis]